MAVYLLSSEFSSAKVDSTFAEHSCLTAKRLLRRHIEIKKLNYLFYINAVQFNQLHIFGCVKPVGPVQWFVWNKQTRGISIV